MIKKIAIVGRDADAWLASLVLKLSLHSESQPVEIDLVELPSTLGPQDLYVTLPSQRGLNRMVGISDFDIMGRCKSLPSLAQRYSGWSGQAGSFVVPYDTAGINQGGVDFIHLWTKGRQNGLDVALEEFSLGSACAKRGKKFLHTEASADYSNASYGFNLSALEYLTSIAQKATAAGVNHRAGSVDHVTVVEGNIANVTLDDGYVIEADLFIDATGPEAVLRSALGDLHNEDWSHWFPADSKVIASIGKMNNVPAFSEHIAFEAGWMGVYPLAARTGVVVNTGAGYADINDAPNWIKSATGQDMVDGKVVSVNSGIVATPWRANCVCLGSSAVSLDALCGADMHLLHTSLAHLVSLLPVDADCGQEARRYNQKIRQHAENIRDYQLAYYWLSRNRPGQFWQRLSNDSLPDSLTQKIDLFQSLGLIPMNESETFQEEAWQALFAGFGIIPKAYSALVNTIPEQSQIQLMQDMLKFVANESGQMTDLATFVELNTEQEFSGSMF
ncbi:tryptophan 7-halogenase [Gilvimarinus sp. SDUM040013]|uniref:Tryptophan 7-halogenase n=1 Tax=Gilvimarinus gilvus TaxID=3058038 RepID=A0ABU4S1G2_9GAMM|nr:tryptophan 7-halogenase [Gilvimarinus sp. SDUM040013]MDO3384415.1 tryptophan 7-halogenase [Gilvimarinus sp. SDUM040013]MDX6851020.1 tryptophan 7-halogenase [Gilvimarinus sp. SDUM040013]